MLHFINNLFSPLSILFFLSILISLHSSLNATSNLIVDSCKKISNNDVNVKYDFCVKKLESDTGGDTAENVAELGTVSFHVIDMKNSMIISQIEMKLKGPIVDPSDRDALNACLNAYYTARDAVYAGLKAFEEGDYITAHSRANAVLQRPYDCENGFKVSPLTRENLDYFQMAAICIGFCDLLYKG